MNAPFTPGPWAVSKDPFWKASNVVLAENGKTVICQSFAGYSDSFDRVGSREAIANTRLIAAAPSLYEALQCLMKWTDCTDVPNEVQTMCHAAIKQATEQEP